MPAARPATTATVTQTGNRVDLRFGDLDFRFDVDGIDLPADLDPSFAAFVLTPIAMRRGVDIAFERPVDPTILSNCNRLAEIWSIWRPGRYVPIQLSSPPGWTRPTRQRLPDLRLYSGGVDSTFPMVQRGHRDPPAHALTLRSMDYKNSSDETYRKFVAKTEALPAALNYRRIFLRSNVKMDQYDPAPRGHADTGSWPFHLATCLTLFSDLFETGILAADYTDYEDLLVFPSSNHVSNGYFFGSDFRVETEGLRSTRIEKIAAIAESPAALQSLTFCTIESSKPENCGRCPKCIRTKAMFMATTGQVPPIFADCTISERQLTRFNLANQSHLAFFLQVVRTARKTGTLDRLPGLEEFVRRGGSVPNRIRGMINRVLVERGYG